MEGPVGTVANTQTIILNAIDAVKTERTLYNAVLQMLHLASEILETAPGQVLYAERLHILACDLYKNLRLQPPIE